MELTRGQPKIVVALIDGPVEINHPDLVEATIREIPGSQGGRCAVASSAACMHGTFVAGILCARRGSPAPSICPGCTLLVRPIFGEGALRKGEMPSATPDDLATAIIECIEAGAHLINVSAALAHPSSKSERSIEEALGHAARCGVTVVAAAGNQGTLGSSAITRDPWVIPVVASDVRGRPIPQSNLGSSLGKHGLAAPGDQITSLGTRGTPLAFGGTSAAAPFVTGALALLQSEFPAAAAAQVRLAVTGANGHRRNSVAPPLLDAWAAYQTLKAAHERS